MVHNAEPHLLSLPNEIVSAVGNALGPWSFLLNLICKQLRVFTFPPPSIDVIIDAVVADDDGALAFLSRNLTTYRTLCNIPMRASHILEPYVPPATYRIILYNTVRLKIPVSSLACALNSFRAFPLVRLDQEDTTCSFIASACGSIDCLNIIVPHENRRKLHWSQYYARAAAVRNDKDLWKSVLSVVRPPHYPACRIAAEASNLLFLEDAHRMGFSLKDACNAAAQAGSLPCLIYAYDNLELWEDSVKLAAGAGNLDILQYLHAHGYALNNIDLSVAAANGQLACIKYAHANGSSLVGVTESAAEGGALDVLKFALDNECALDSDIATRAAKSDCVNILEFLHETGLPFADSILRDAITSDSTDAIKFLRQLGYRWPDDSTELIASFGSLTTLKYVIENGGPRNPLALSFAAMRGRLDYMEYLRSQGVEWHPNTFSCAIIGSPACVKFCIDNGCPVDDKACPLAASKGHLDLLKVIHRPDCRCGTTSVKAAASLGRVDCFKFLHKSGCPLDNIMLNDIVEFAGSDDIDPVDSADCAVYALEQGCTSPDAKVCMLAARAGNIKLLRLAHGKGFPMDSEALLAAVRGNHLECVVFMHANDVPWPEHTCKAAAQFGNLLCLSYSCENGSPATVEAAKVAAMGAHIECLVYLLQNGVSTTEEICAAAASSGNLACLRAACDAGCPLGPLVTAAAAGSGNVEMLRMLHEQACPWDSSTLQAAAEAGSLACLKYAHVHGCPIADGFDSFDDACESYIANHMS